MNGGKEERKKKERERRKKERTNHIFTFKFLECEKDSLNSVTIFYIRIAKGFHL